MKLKQSMSAQCLIVLDINNNNGDSLNLNETKRPFGYIIDNKISRNIQ